MAHSGLKPNAGRPKGQGTYQGEVTKPIRIPLSRVAEGRQLLDAGLSYQLPLYGCH
ncbi:MAG: hypothetical protein Q8M40_12610 [Legionella sp.]|nr:hypothetical protein [Legionella sp.]